MTTTVTRLNLEDVPAMIELSKKLGVSRFTHFNFVSGFEEAFKIELVPGEILEFEEQSSTRLEAEKYATKEWNFKR